MAQPTSYKATRSLDAGFRAMEEGDRSFEISFSSEEPVERWYGLEYLDHGDGCVDLTRLENMGVLLFGHRMQSVDDVIGKITKVWIEDHRGKAIVQFDDDETSEKVRKKVESGTLKGVSVGYSIDLYEDIAVGKKSADGRFAGPGRVATRWTPYEISIVPVPADDSVGVGRAAGMDPLDLYARQLQLNENLAKALGVLGK